MVDIITIGTALWKYSWNMHKPHSLAEVMPIVWFQVPGGNSRDIFYMVGNGFGRQGPAVSGIMESGKVQILKQKMALPKGLFRVRKMA